MRHHEVGAVQIDRDQRIAGLKHPGVHHRPNRPFDGFFQRVPQVGRLRVAVGVLGEIVAHPFSKRVRPQVLLQHPQHGGAFFVGQDVEHGPGVVRVSDGELDRAGTAQPVDVQGRGARDAEARPALPFGLPVVHRHHFHESGERLVEPQSVPPAHGHQVAEPHVRVLVRDDVRYTLQFAARRGVFVDQQGRLAERDRAQILHRAEREVGNRDQVQFVARIGPAVIGAEEFQRRRADGLSEAGQPLLARHRAHPQRGAVHEDRRARLELADDEGDQIGGHLHRVREHDFLLARVGQQGFAHDPGVGNGRQRLVHDQRDLKDRLERRLVPARKRPSCVGRFELRGRQRLGVPVGVRVSAAVEAAQLVVQEAGERDVQGVATGGQRPVEAQRRAFVRFVEESGAGERPAVRVGNRHRLYVEFAGVEDEVAGFFPHDEFDRFLAREPVRGQVGRQPDDVAFGVRGIRQAVGFGCGRG